MKTNKFSLSYLLFCVAWFVGVFASKLEAKSLENGYKLSYQKWTPASGMPDWKIYSYFQDKQGLLWLATQEGLFTFDGVTFREVLDARTANKGGYVRSVLQDKNGMIWLLREMSSAAEIAILDPQTETLLPLYAYLGVCEEEIKFEGRDILGLARGDGNIWVALEKAIYKYDGTWRRIFGEGRDSYHWMPAKEGLWLVNYEKKRVVWYNENSGIRDTFVLPADLEWRGNFGDGSYNFYLRVFDQSQKESYLQFSSGKDRILQKELSSPPKIDWFNQVVYAFDTNRLLSFGLDLGQDKDEYWLKDIGGKFAFNVTKDYSQLLNSTPLFVDRNGGLWSSNPEGLYRWSIAKNPSFQTYLNDGAQVESTRGIVQQENTLFVASYYGAKKVDLSTGRSTEFRVPWNTALTVMKRAKNGLWIGLISGQEALYFLGDDGRMESYFIDSLHTQVSDIKILNEHTLWLGTRNGLVSFDISTKKYRKLAFENKAVSFIHENDQGFWLGTQDGLYLIDRQANILKSYLQQNPQLIYRRLAHLYEAPSGEFWVATAGAGLIRLDPDNGTYEQFNTANGLSNDYLHAVYGDNSGHLWIPSDFGLMRINTMSKLVETFFSNDGIAENEFNMLSHYQAPDGRLFFGGIKGITSFHPDNFEPAEVENIPLKIVEASTFDIGETTYQYQIRNCLGEKVLKLKPSDSFLEISLSSLSFQVPGQLNFAWRIEGLQQEWVEQQEPTLRLSNLPYGTHRLQFTGFLKGNRVLEDYSEIEIQVLRPFYLTFPFLGLVVLVGFVLLGLFTKWRTHRIRAENLKLERLIQARTRQVEQDNAIIVQQAEDLRRLNEVKTRFFANITHELRTPLSLILGPLEVMMGEPGGSENSRRNLSVIQRNAKRLLNLINELLDLSKIEEKEAALDLVELRVLPFLRRMMESFSAVAESKQISLLLDYRADDDLMLLMDRMRWEKIIQNLLSNAMKFTPSQGKITLTFEVRSNTYLLQVADTGNGIAKEDLPHIFDRFYQGKGAHKLAKGSGIGLSLVKAYCELFDAELNVKSTLGKGAVFSILFSAEVPITPEGLTQKGSGEGLGDDVRLSADAKERIRPVLLIVEDEPDMQDFLMDVLQQDYRVQLAQNGVEALKILNRCRVDLVLSDLMMPEMDGIELLRRVKTSYPDLPFVLLTARAEEQDKLEALTTGVDDYLTKPFKTRELLARLMNLASRYHIRRRLESVTTDTNPELRFDQQWLRQLEEVVKENLGNPDFSILMLAERMHISERSLQYKTKAHTGLNPKQYVVEIRLTEAMRLLQAGVYASVSEVCYAVGFKSTQYFAKLMKQRFGQSPSEVLQAGFGIKNSDS